MLLGERDHENANTLRKERNERVITGIEVLCER